MYRNYNINMANMRANMIRANNRRINFLLHDDSGIDSDDELLEQRRQPKQEDPFLVLSEDEEVGYLNYMRSNMEREFGHLRNLNPDYVIDRNRLPRVGGRNSPIIVGPNRNSPPLYEVELSQSDEDEESVLELVIPLRSRYNKRHPPNLKSLIFGTFLCCFARK